MKNFIKSAIVILVAMLCFSACSTESRLDYWVDQLNSVMPKPLSNSHFKQEMQECKIEKENNQVVFVIDAPIEYTNLSAFPEDYPQLAACQLMVSFPELYSTIIDSNYDVVYRYKNDQTEKTSDLRIPFDLLLKTKKGEFVK